MKNWRVYIGYAQINLKSTLQYKAWRLSMLTVAVNSIVDFLAIMILFARFGSIGDWQAQHVLLIYGIATASFGLAEWFSRGYDIFPHQVNTGFFDRILLRPRSTFLQVMGNRFEFQRFGRVAVGLGCIFYSIIKLKCGLDIMKFVALIGAVTGGWMVYTGIFIMLAALSFWTLQPLDISYIFTNATLGYAQIPLPLLGKYIQRTLTLIFPLGLCYYYPAVYITNMSQYPDWVAFMAFPGGLVFFTISLLTWNFGVGHYHSSGN
jgi:ABC-2 type transport system permease protein